jgi:hypothetical protein
MIVGIGPVGDTVQMINPLIVDSTIAGAADMPGESEYSALRLVRSSHISALPDIKEDES